MTGRRRTTLIVVLVLAWGSTFAAIKIGLEHSSPVMFAALRPLLGSIALGAVALRLGKRPRLAEHASQYAVLTLLNIVGFFGLQTLALGELPSGLASVLIYLQPVLTGVLAGPLLGEHVGRGALLGLALGFAGILVVGVSALDGHVSVLGVAYAVTAALVWALGTIAIKRSTVDVWWGVAIPFGSGGVVLLVIAVLLGQTQLDWTPAFVAALAYSTLIGSSLSWGLWYALVAAGEAARTAAVIFFVPIVAIVIGVVFLDEELHVSLAVGAALVVVGVWLVNRRPAARPARRTQPANSP